MWTYGERQTFTSLLHGWCLYFLKSHHSSVQKHRLWYQTNSAFFFNSSNGEYVSNRSFDFSGRQCHSWNHLQRDVHLPLSWNDFYRRKSRGPGGTSNVQVTNKQWILCVLWLFGSKPVYVQHVIHWRCDGELWQRTPSLLLQWHGASTIHFFSGRYISFTK